MALQIPGAEGRQKVPLVGYDEQVARLDNVFDAICALNETLISVYSKRGNKRQSNRAPRPETAQQRVRREQSMNKLNSIVQQMTGGR